MSFFDQVLRKTSSSGEKMVRIVEQYRPKIYTKIVKDEETRQMIEVVIGEGFEIVKEVQTTERGAALWHEKNPTGATWTQ